MSVEPKLDERAMVAVPVDAVRALARLSRQLDHVLAKLDLTAPQYRMLVLLEEHPSEVASALADQLSVSRPSITALVDGLVAKGLVDRTSDASDRRRVLHAITEAGRAAVSAAETAVVERLSQLTAAGPRAAAKSAVKGLADWKDVLDELNRELKRQEGKSR